MTVLLPNLDSEDDYREVYQKDHVWLPAISAICERHGFSTVDLRRQVLGTHVVYRTGNLIVKLFCRFWPDDFSSERTALRGLRDLPIPELVEIGELESWPYLILTALEGCPASDVWPTLGVTEKTGIIHQIGEFMRRLHRHALIPGLRADWDSFLSERIACLDDHHQLSEPWREWVHGKVASVNGQAGELVTLNSDLTDDHVLLAQQRGRWRVSGIIDFADSMIGHPLYEFGAPLFCFFSGEPVLAKALVESYGEQLTPELTDDILSYSLLHQFMTLSSMLEVTKARGPEALVEAVWGGTSPR